MAGSAKCGLIVCQKEGYLGVWKGFWKGIWKENLVCKGLGSPASIVGFQLSAKLMRLALSWQQLTEEVVSPGRIQVQDLPFLSAPCIRKRRLEIKSA